MSVASTLSRRPARVKEVLGVLAKCTPGKTSTRSPLVYSDTQTYQSSFQNLGCNPAARLHKLSQRVSDDNTRHDRVAGMSFPSPDPQLATCSAYPQPGNTTHSLNQPMRLRTIQHLYDFGLNWDVEGFLGQYHRQSCTHRMSLDGESRLVALCETVTFIT